jgi:uncharacterized protein with FMN-binding domain
MKRTPIVLTGTACGLVAVIGYHAAIPQASALTASSAKSTATTAASTTSTRPSAKTRTTSTASETTRSAVGSDIQYQYGDIEVKVTMTGSKITDVSVASLNVTDPRSESIDEYAIPELRSEALQAQSANIDGVSGASYTSAAYEQSLQSAIDKLKA